MKPKSKPARRSQTLASPIAVLDLDGQHGGTAMPGSEARFSQMVNAMPLLAWIAQARWSHFLV